MLPCTDPALPPDWFVWSSRPAPDAALARLQVCRTCPLAARRECRAATTRRQGDHPWQVRGGRRVWRLPLAPADDAPPPSPDGRRRRPLYGLADQGRARTTPAIRPTY